MRFERGDDPLSSENDENDTAKALQEQLEQLQDVNSVAGLLKVRSLIDTTSSPANCSASWRSAGRNQIKYSYFYILQGSPASQILRFGLTFLYTFCIELF